MDYTTTVRNFIKENFLFGADEKIDAHISFLENGILDSTGVLELVTFLEENYNISIEDDELIPENLDSLQNIARFLDSKIQNL